MILPTNLLMTTQVHLNQLVAERAEEGPHIDFKRELPATWDQSAKHEFLADITAFANSGGGDLVYGIDEDGEAHASRIVPQVIANVDQEVRRLLDFLLNLAEPRIPGVQVHAIVVTVEEQEGHVLVVRVPQSWAGPHRVKTNQHFYIRDGLRKRPLDVPEIGSLFVRNESQARRVRDFRTERLGKILTGEAPHQLLDAPILVVHLIPTQAAQGLVQIDPVPYMNERGLPILGVTSPRIARLNIDGALVVRGETIHGQANGYSQFFRNGFFEATYVLEHQHQSEPGFKTLPSKAYEDYLIELLGSFRSELDRLGINYECAVMLSLLRANEVKLGVSIDILSPPSGHQNYFDRKVVVLPDVLVPAQSSSQIGLKPVFDLLWQAAGFTRSRNYNSEGVRV
ncbi:MAG: ATP-binding protein [Moraxellaceae bacterium]|nr:MAG: ATP-binding protein [Moraxellaceae bacterium]